MLNSFDFYLLVLPTLSIFIGGILILSLYIKNFKVIFIISLLKSLIFFIYFFYFFNGTFTFQDDWHYLEEAHKYIADDNNFFKILFTNPFGFMFIFSNNHFLYQLYNVLSFHLFGEYYFSPVALNIIITYMTSYILYKLLLIFNIKRKYVIYFVIFYLLYWDTLSWSSMLNLKDILVQFFELSLIYNIIRFEILKDKFSLIYIFILVVLFETIRFYIPYLIFIAFLIYKVVLIFFRFKKIQNKIIFGVFLFIVLIVFIKVFMIYFSNEINHLMSNFINPLYGSFRFLMTPLPFHTEEAYSFLYFSSVLNWLFLPFLILGIYKFYKIFNDKVVIFIFSYLFIILLFYGAYGELQGPRHRIQILPILSFFQLFGLMTLFFGNKIKFIKKEYKLCKK